MKHISSSDNPLIKSIVALKTKKGRSEQQLFLAEGMRTCETIIKAGFKPEYILATEQFLSQNVNFFEHAYWAIFESTYVVVIVTQKIMEKISSSITPSGIICVFAIPKLPSYNAINAGIVLADIQDPGNMGTLIRTCAAFGKKTIILIDGTDPWSSKVVQSSAGTIALVTIFQLSWEQLLEHKKNNKLIALVVKDGKNLKDINCENALLVVGSEAHGIPEAYVKTCDDLATIAMPGNTESLNAATAGAIAMYLAWTSK